MPTRSISRFVRSRAGLSPSAKLAALVACVMLAAAIVGLVAHFATASRADLLGIVAGSPYLMLGAPLAALICLAARLRLGLVLTAAMTIACASTQSRLYVASPAPADGVSVVTMTANLRIGQGSATAVVDAVRRDHVDLLMLEELTPLEQDRLVAAGLTRLLPHSISDPRPYAAGTGLWSRFPLSDTARHGGFGFALVSARVHIPGLELAPLTVATHMSGPVPDATNWSHDIAALPSFLRGLTGHLPAVIGGDFNATPDTAQFRRLLGNGYRDAAEQAGAGMTRTYPADTWFPPLIAIDHVLTRGAVARSAWTVRIPGSDHRALAAIVDFSRPAR